MYLHATSNLLSPLRFFAVFVVLLLGAVNAGYGQRVYADVEQHDATPLLASVANPQNTILNSGSDTSIHSILNVTLGLVGLVSAKQNLRFVSVATPTPTTPVMVKFSTPGSLLDLLGGLSIQRTNSNSPILPSYNGIGLLELLNLFGGGKTAILKIPPTGVQFDGVRLEINTTLGVARTVNYYYAFYITPPEIPATASACEGVPVNVVIANYNSAIEDQGYPYTYRLYTEQLPLAAPLVETPIENVIFNNGALTLPADLAAGDYYLEARENDIYPSARIKITLARNEPPGISLAASTLNICQEDDSADLPYTFVTNNPISYSINWDASAEAAGFIDIPETPYVFFSAGGSIPISIPPNAAEGNHQGLLTAKNANGCTDTAHPITISVQPKPAAPNLTITQSQY